VFFWGVLGNGDIIFEMRYSNDKVIALAFKKLKGEDIRGLCDRQIDISLPYCELYSHRMSAYIFSGYMYGVTQWSRSYSRR
jgi:hypothetical protein